MSAVHKLDLRPGQWVEVRSVAEILSTLNESSALDGLPFMPEMLQFCGRRFKVYKRADRTCDPVSASSNGLLFRRMQDTVHLETARCDGSSHGGCQAQCLMFWKEAWLRRVPHDIGQSEPDDTPVGAICAPRDLVQLRAATQRDPTPEGHTCYRCQATELQRASSPLPFWRPTQYLRDVFTNAVPLKDVIFALAVILFSKIRIKLTGKPFPNVLGSLKRTPVENLDLLVGEWVVVKSREEIIKTLDTRARNRGMTFESEMLPYCGQRYRVVRRVEKIIDEASGRMKQLSATAVVLENVICASAYRRPCPRANHLFWREIWLRRAEPHEQPPATPCEAAATCALAQAAGMAEADA
jgi:hypothetical protein